MCIFCGERNEAFNEEGIDLHYWKECPMLKRCQHCKQVVEIANLTAHLLTECEKREEFGKCNRCGEAISKTDLDAHVKAKTCNGTKSLTFSLFGHSTSKLLLLLVVCLQIEYKLQVFSIENSLFT